MNAFDRAMKAIEKLMARASPRPSPQPSPQRKSAKPGLKRSRKKRSAKSRVVSAAPRHTRPEPYNPPRSEPEFPELDEVLEPGPITPAYRGAPEKCSKCDLDPELPENGGCQIYVCDRCGALVCSQCSEDGPDNAVLCLPCSDPPKLKPTRPSWADAWERASNTPPEVPKVAPRPAQARTLGSCKAIDADTGRQCRLPAHPEEPERHRHERGPFFRTLTPGEVPLLRQRLDGLATMQSDAIRMSDVASVTRTAVVRAAHERFREKRKKQEASP